MRSKNHTLSGSVARQQRQEDALRRQTERDSRTPAEQIEVLNARLGGAFGAERESDRLLEQANGRTPEQQRADLEASA